MTERYGKCTPCAGFGCLACAHSGFSGDALAYVEAQSLEERQREPKGGWSLREQSLRLSQTEDLFYKNPERTPGLLAAVAAIEAYTNKQKTKRDKNMSQVPVVKNETTQMSISQKFGFTETQLDLVKRTVAKNATNDELELFFYRCKELGLNPLMPGQVYFLKFGTAPGTIVIGLDGFRARAQRTGKLSGIKRGVIRDAQGVCIGGWADVYRKDWDHPAHEEVTLAEYMDPRKATWKSMPETMIKKVAEVAALRMAFPDELGGVYSQEEMDQADRGGKVVKNVESDIGEAHPSLAQIRRLFTIAGEAKVSQEELKEILLMDYAKSSTKDLTMEQYNKICQDLAARVSLAVATEISQNSEIPENLEPGSDADEDSIGVVGVAKDVPWAKYRE